MVMLTGQVWLPRKIKRLGLCRRDNRSHTSLANFASADKQILHITAQRYTLRSCLAQYLQYSIEHFLDLLL